MENIWSIVVSSLLGLTVVGDIVMRLLFRTERRKAEASAGAEENRMWHDRLLEQREANRDLNALVASMTEQLKTANQESADKTRQIRKLNAMLMEEQVKNLNYERYLAAKDRFIDWLLIWHCRREQNGRKSGCDRRLPQQDVPVPYTPPPEMEEATARASQFSLRIKSRESGAETIDNDNSKPESNEKDQLQVRLQDETEAD